MDGENLRSIDVTVRRSALPIPYLLNASPSSERYNTHNSLPKGNGSNPHQTPHPG